jgi:DNA polymerase-3 subunit chi
MPTIDFYVLSDAAPDAHLRHACRLAELAAEQGKRVFIRVAHDGDMKRMDDLLWTFGDRSFLPHEVARDGTAPSHERIRVLIGIEPPPAFRDVVINLHPAIPAEVHALQCVVELVPADDGLKRAARSRFKAYRDAGHEPVTQNV